jgi:[ribosomal protein S18]-alanine N-acetyltransferase
MIAAVGAEAAATLAALHARAFPRGWSAAELVKLLENPAAFALADRQGQGFVLAWVVADEAEILTLAVAPEARRRGLGAALVREAARLAQARGAAALHLEVAEDNLAARALYAKLGFAEAGRRLGYYAAGAMNAIVMRRTLPI